MTKINIVGAGLAGLLCSAMMREDINAVFESQKEIPNNHSALLRFRSSVVSDVLGIPFKKVQVLKAVDKWMNPVADALAYSRKTNGTATLRSVISAEGKIDERYIAPEDLISRMYRMSSAKVNLGTNYNFDGTFDGPVISTIPMPSLMKILGYEMTEEFKWVEGFNINTKVSDVEAYVTLYIPDLHNAINRISLTGSKLTIECALPGLSSAQAKNAINNRSEMSVLEDVRSALELLGLGGCEHSIPVISRQQYAKILPINDQERKRFIMWASENHNIYSLGRFATWRPGLLLDDVVNDVRVIQRIMSNGNYDHKTR